jgi:glycosyltransferase involved in cell wall biosynthesis
VKVCATFHDGHLGGATLSVLNAVPALAERGVEFAFWVDRPSELYDLLAERGHVVDGAPRQVGFSRRWLAAPPGPRKLRGTPGWLAGWMRFLRRERPDVVHANTLYTLPEAAIARAMGLPVLFHVHEMLPPKGRLVPRAVGALGIEPATVSQACAAAFAGGARRPRVVHESAVVPSHPRPPRRPGDPLVIGTVGWVCERKGTDLFLEVARRVRAAMPDVEVRLVGPTTPSSADYPWARARVAEAIADGVRYWPRADVAAQLRQWDVFVLCSRYDPFPLVVLEALAHGVPVVATRVDGVAEQVTPACGLLAEPEDAAGLAEHVLALLRDADRRAAMGAAGRERVIENFTERHQARSLEAAYREVAA